LHLFQDNEKNRKIYEVYRQLFEDTKSRAIIERLVKGFYIVSNVNVDNSRTTFDEIWDAILSSAPLQSQWEKKFPVWWLERERIVMNMKSDGVKVLTFSDIQCINKHLENADNSDKDVALFLRYLNRYSE